MEKDKKLSDSEEEIKKFFENIDVFFEEFKLKIKNLKSYKYSDALEEHNEKFTNEFKEFVSFRDKAIENYKHFANMFNAEINEKNKKISETTENYDLNEETKTSSELFKELIKSILNKFKK